jgi:predicted RNA-binding protein Jag
MIGFSRFLNEGLIKLPQKMFDEGSTYLVSKICSYPLTEIKSLGDLNDFQKQIQDHLEDVAKKYKAKIQYTRKMNHTTVKLKRVYDDLPEKYRTHAQEFKSGLTLYVDWIHGKEFQTKNGYFRKSGEGMIGVSIWPIVKYDWKRHVKNVSKQEHVETICHYIDSYVTRILDSFEHELTHFVQFKILPHSEKQFSKGDNYRTDRHANKSGYSTSKAEFDPILRNEISKYMRIEKENLEIKMSKSKRSAWISCFVGAKPYKPDPKKDMLDLPDSEVGYVKPSDFFLNLKKHSESRWKLACKLFTQEVEKRSP